MKVTIAPDFEHLLQSHEPAELEQLEKNCLADPNHEQMPPVQLWSNHHNTLVDGHNQYRIRTKHGLKIKYVRLTFGTRDEAMRHALDVQFGRRNSNASQRAMAYAKLPRNSHGGDRKSDQGVNLPLEKLAEQAGVSHKTMKDAARVADKAAAPIVEAVEAGEVKVSDAVAILELTPAQQVQALKTKRSGKAKTVREAATDFDPTKFKPAKPGSQKRSPADRKAALQLLGKLVRLLDKLHLSADVEVHLKAINQAIKDAT